MRRRTVLAGLTGASLPLTAGCLGGSGSEPECPNTTTEDIISDQTDEDRIPEENGLRMEVTDVDEPPAPLCFEMIVQENRVSYEKSPVIEITATNAGSETITWEHISSIEYVFPARRTDDEVLLLDLKPQMEEALLDEQGCLKSGGVPRDDIVIETTLEPDESLTQTYMFAVNANVVEIGCPPAGTYRIESEYNDHGTWGFEIALEE